MIISAFNNENLESVLLDALANQGIEYQESEDRHLGRSWEVGQLPRVPDCVWEKSVMYGKTRHLLKARPLSESEMLEMVKGLSFQKSSVYNELVADFPIDFNEVCRLPFVHRVKRGWTTFRAVWDAPNGQTYIFRTHGRGSHFYSYIFLGTETQ